MKVKELIEKLQKFDKESTVLLRSSAIHKEPSTVVFVDEDVDFIENGIKNPVLCKSYN